MKWLLKIGISIISLTCFASAYASYYVHIDNNFGQAITVSDGTTINSGSSWDSTQLGGLKLMIPDYGTVIFQDIGTTHIDGDTNGAWGVLISYHDEDIVGRYDGNGQLNVAVGAYGAITIAGMSFADVVISRLVYN